MFFWSVSSHGNCPKSFRLFYRAEILERRGFNSPPFYRFDCLFALRVKMVCSPLFQVVREPRFPLSAWSFPFFPPPNTKNEGTSPSFALLAKGSRIGGDPSPISPPSFLLFLRPSPETAWRNNFEHLFFSFKNRRKGPPLPPHFFFFFLKTITPSSCTRNDDGTFFPPCYVLKRKLFFLFFLFQKLYPFFPAPNCRFRIVLPPSPLSGSIEGSFSPPPVRSLSPSLTVRKIPLLGDTEVVHITFQNPFFRAARTRVSPPPRISENSRRFSSFFPFERAALPFFCRNQQDHADPEPETNTECPSERFLFFLFFFFLRAIGDKTSRDPPLPFFFPSWIPHFFPPFFFSIDCLLFSLPFSVIV